MKVRTHLFLVGIAILIPFAVFAALALKLVLASERDAAVRSMQETARATALMVDAEANKVISSLGFLARSPALVHEHWQDLHAQAGALKPTLSGWTALSANNTLLFETNRNYAPADQTPLVPVSEATPATPSQPTVSGFLRESRVAQALVAIDLPARAQSGKIYTLTQWMPADHFLGASMHRLMPSSWMVGILDRNGIVIAHSHKATQLVGKLAKHDLSTRILSAGTTEGAVLDRTMRDGTPVDSAFAKSETTGWTVVVSAPSHPVQQAARKVGLLVILGLLATVACAGVLAMLVGKRICRSIACARACAGALGRGQRTTPTRSGVAEIDDLNQALSDANTVLQSTQSERDRLLSLEQEARRNAEALNKSKDEFLAMLGHELRNPLSAIAGAIAVADDANAHPGQTQRAMEIVRRQSEHLGNIVDDLLDLGRVMTGKIHLRCQHIDLAEAVEQCVATVRTGSLDRHHWRVQTESVWIDADPTRLEQMISNILVNAVKYTPPQGTITVTVRTDGERALFSVQDSGIGIPKQILPHVFDVFVQGPASMARSQGGLGIGLSLVRQIATLHGGNVTAQSEGLGCGTTFTLQLPRVAFPQPPQIERDDAISVYGREVLVVEDNDDGREMLCMMLELHGCNVAQARDGEEALAIIEEAPPQLAIVDIGLPGMSGYDIARWVRSQPALAHVRLIALTGYGLEEDRQRAMDAGFNQHMSKPYSLDKLLKALNSD